MVAAVEQTDPRTQPGAVVKVPSGARCFVTGYKDDRVLVDYETRTLGSDAYPLHLLTLVQEAPKEGLKPTRSNAKRGRRVSRSADTTAHNEDENPLEFCSEVVVEGHKLPFTYIPAFLAQDEADLLLKHSLELNWQQNEIKMFGKPVVLPRLEAIYGEGDYTYNGLTLQASPWSSAQAIYSLKQAIEEETGHSYQIAIGNQYRDGSDHIGWHSDDSPELGEKPAIASLSLGSTRRFQLRHKLTKEVHTFELNHGDLFVMLPGCQEEWVHRICKTSNDVGVRVNWTFRPRLQPTGAGEVIEAEIVVSRSEQLRQLEAEIEQGTAAREKAERQIWIAAAQIKSEKLWREAGFDSFEAYCRDRFGWEKSNAYEVAGAGEVVLQLQAAGAEEIPNSVAAVQVLKKVAPESRLQVLQTAKEESGKLTADALKQAVVKVKEPDPDPYEYQPIEPKACWFLAGSNWVEGQAIAKNQRELYRVVWGEDRETAIPAQRLQWTAPIVIPPPAERLAPPVTGRDWMEGDQVSGVDDNGEPVEGIVWVVGPGYLRLKDNRVCYQPKLINFAPVDADPAIEETSPPAEPESELTPAQKTLLYNLKLIAQGASDQVYNQLCKQVGESDLEFLAEVSEEVNEAIAAILERSFLED